MMKKIIYVFVSVMFLISMIIGVVELRIYDRSFYASEYSKLETYESIGISEEDLMETTDVLLSYMERKRDDMVVEATINGEQREVFNERETLHMADVVRLLKLADYFKWTFYAATLLMLMYVGFKRDFKVFGKCALVGVGVLFIFLALVGGYVLIDFNGFWTLFHKILFTNDLWLLDPRTSVMINMFPEPFFNALVIQIVSLSVVGVILYSVFGYMCIKGLWIFKEQ